MWVATLENINIQALIFPRNLPDSLHLIFRDLSSHEHGGDTTSKADIQLITEREHNSRF